MLPSLFNQMAFLFALIIIGFALARFKIVPENSTAVLSKLENWLFIPALVLSTFIGEFTVERLSHAGEILAFSLAIEAVVIPLSIFCVRLLSKDKYTQNAYLYGLCFSNFGFMGNAIVSVMFPDIFLEYLVFTLVLWVLIYLWGVPVLLIGQDAGGERSARLKSFLNPMLIAAVVGMGLGLLGFKPPEFLNNMFSSLGGCMSPVAMLITGLTIAKMDLKSVFKSKNVYILSALRLLVFPLLFIGACEIFDLGIPTDILVCATASLSMPMGLNSIVVPLGYGRDTTVAAGTVLVSHLLSVVTIPVIFTLVL